MYEVLVPTDECKALSGYNAPVITALAKGLNVSFASAFAALCLAHMNISYEQLAIVLQKWIIGKTTHEAENFFPQKIRKLHRLFSPFRFCQKATTGDYSRLRVF